MATTLVITNDFPPSIGGIEALVAQVCHLLGDVVVLTRAQAGAAAYDTTLPFPVHRTGRVLLPDAATLRAAVTLLRRHDATRVVFGAAAPLGLLAGPLRRAGATRILAITHGHETWWAQLPGTRQALRHIGAGADAVSWISAYTRERIAPALSPAARAAMVRLAPPVDTARFAPGPRPDRPTVVAAGRFVAQKGFETLLAAWTGVLDRWPHRALPELVLIGDGPLRRRLQAAAARLPVGAVRFTGAVPHARMPALLRQAHVFALPVRTRLAGLNPEGLGLVFAEAAAAGLAVLAGRSGGTPEVLLPGVSGHLVNPVDADAWSRRLGPLLLDPHEARAMGEAGRRHIERHFAPAIVAETLRRVLQLPAARTF